MTLKIFLNKNNYAFGSFYYDDGISFDYQKGLFSYYTMEYKNGELSIVDVNYSEENQSIKKPKVEKIQIYYYLNKKELIFDEEINLLDKIKINLNK